MTRAQRALLDWYRQNGRSHLPWRRTRDPYRIVVSEFMLQQTQVDRVLPKYREFIDRFPGVEALAKASRADVLRLWGGLGYNSRAVRLKRLAQEVLERFEGRLPGDERQLRLLPGIGPYTVAAIRAFAFNYDAAAIDTNVRRIVHRVLHGIEFPPAVGRARLDESARALVPAGRAHDWNSAMMDLGATICTARAPKCLICPLRQSCAAAPLDAARLDRARSANAPHRSPQEAIPFEQTTRYARGRIIDSLRYVPAGKRIPIAQLHRDVAHLGRTAEQFEVILAGLERDGLVRIHKHSVALQD